MKLKIRYILLIFLIVIFSFSHVLAAETVNTLEVVKKSSETKMITDDYGYIVKSIVDSNPANGEITIELKLSNTAAGEEGTIIYENTELFLIVDEKIVLEEEKFENYMGDVEKLASKIIDASPKISVGLVGIKGPVRDVEVLESGTLKWNEGDQGDIPGSDENAEIITSPTRDVEKIKNSLKNMNSEKVDYYSNLQAAIKLANKSYSKEVNRILICLYDGVPAVATGVQSTVQYRSDPEGAVKDKHEKVSTYTRNEILALKKTYTSFIMLRPPDTSYDEVWYSITTGKKILDFDGSPYVNKLYGTVSNPTYGKMYEFTDENIDKIITEDIYKDVQEMLQPDLKKVKIVDYFPADIVNNFTFEIAKDPSQGTISKKIDSEEDFIEWDLGDVNQQQMATVQYKLKLTDMDCEKILGREVETNEKVVLTYTDSSGKDHEINLTSSPSVKLTQKEVQNPASSPNPSHGSTTGGDEKTYEGKDPTVSSEILPKAGWEFKLMLILMFLTFSISGVVILSKKNKEYKDIK